MIECIVDKPSSHVTPIPIILAHGAGAAMDSPWMSCLAEGLVAKGITVVRFNFPYMSKAKLVGRRQPPNPIAQLVSCFANVVDLHGHNGQCVVAGKSMGGRVASMLLANQVGLGAVSLGYPFHPRNKPEKIRNEHWINIDRPWLIIQGDRDPLGCAEDVDGLVLPKTSHVEWLIDGDHDFKPRKRSGLSQQQHLESACNIIFSFVRDIRGN